MNPKLNFIFTRRSVRRYEDREISDELIRDLLEAAMAAPSACCADPWEFLVLRDRNLLTAVAETLPYGKMLPTGGAGIVVCGNMEKAHDGQESYMLQDCSAAIQNLLLAANALGLGTCWLGVHPREDRVAYIQKLFSLPDHIIPIAAIAIGWPAEAPEARTRYQDDAVHNDAW